MLDGWGVPWRASRRELAARFGVHICPWSADTEVVLVPGERAFLPGLLRPFSYWESDRNDPDFPPLSLTGSLWVGDDALGNLDAARRELKTHLGGGERYDMSNTRGWRWHDGAASVTIIGWPPELQHDFGPNTWHQREPRLITACSIAIETGARIACSAQEAAWLDDFSPALNLPVPPLSEWFSPRTPRQGWLEKLLGPRKSVPVPSVVETMAAQRVSPAEQPYVRLPPPEVARLHGRLGLSPDGSTLIWCAGQLKMVPLDHITGVHLEKIAPAKGSGGNQLELCCQRDAAAPTVSCTVLDVSAPQSLDDVAEALATLIARPLTIGHSSDC